jgi:hypothetical protein
MWRALMMVAVGLCTCSEATPEAATSTSHQVRRLDDGGGGGAASFSVGSGDPCRASGRCIYSPNYPSRYGNSQHCTFTPIESGSLECGAFDVENSYDRIEIDGTRFSGHSLSNCPDGVDVHAGVAFTWRTDGSVTNSGFQICMAGPPTAAQCEAIDEERRADPKCGDRADCPLECALSHLPAMTSCEENYPAPSFRAQCQEVVDALVDQGPAANPVAPAASCPFAGDGACDEPSQCAVGTDPDCAPSNPDDPRDANVCPTDATCPPPRGSVPDRAAWTELLYYDADNK